MVSLCVGNWSASNFEFLRTCSMLIFIKLGDIGSIKDLYRRLISVIEDICCGQKNWKVECVHDHEAKTD